MKMKYSFRNFVPMLVRSIGRLLARQRPASGPSGTDLNLDALTESGLPLREAIPVRSAEYWMEMGYPELAMEELDSLSEDATRHAWPRQVRQQLKPAAAL